MWKEPKARSFAEHAEQTCVAKEALNRFYYEIKGIAIIKSIGEKGTATDADRVVVPRPSTLPDLCKLCYTKYFTIFSVCELQLGRR